MSETDGVRRAARRVVITSLDNGMSMLDVDSYWQMIVKGSILVLAVWVDVSTRTGRR